MGQQASTGTGTAGPVAEELGASGADPRPGGPGDAVGGTVPALVATPPDTAALAAVLEVASRHDLAVVPRGHGSKLDWGAPPRRCDLVVDTTALTGIEHAAGDLVVRVGAGTPLSDLRVVLASAGQRLTVDPVVPESTVGGVVATGLSGPRRILHGPVRDLIIGMTTVLADGTTASSGGRVVKNVAGYDLGKLHTGALGTLGVIASVTFRLHPVPPALRLVTATTTDPATARGWARAARQSASVPAAVEIEWPAEGRLTVRVLVEGAEGGIEARTAEIAGLLETSETDIVAELPPDWGALPGEPGDTLLKLAVPPADAAGAAATLRATAREAGLPVSVRGSAGAGVLYAALPASAEPAAAARVVERVRAAVELPRPAAPAAEGARGEGPVSGDAGHLTVVRAARTLAEHGVDRHGDVPGLPLMRAVKDRFDPHHVLAPGRLAGGV